MDHNDKDFFNQFNIAVLIPCYNEELTIKKVVKDFSEILPNANIYVYDNNSTDRTAEIAKSSGATVRREYLQGKGNVVRRMFSDINSDVYVLVDGDDTYDAHSVHNLIYHLINEQLDMVNASRFEVSELAYRRGHRLGNFLLSTIIAKIFGNRFSDLLSGYRVFSHRFVKSFPVMSTGFEIETELTVHALELSMPISEIQTPYKKRQTGSFSKLHTYKDGLRIIKTILVLFKEEKPLIFFTLIFILLAGISVTLAIPIFITYVKTGLVPRFPTAILSTGLMILAFLSFTCGLILDTVTLGRKEMKRLNYLNKPIFSKDYYNAKSK